MHYEVRYGYQDDVSFIFLTLSNVYQLIIELHKAIYLVVELYRVILALNTCHILAMVTINELSLEANCCLVQLQYKVDIFHILSKLQHVEKLHGEAIFQMALRIRVHCSS